MIGTYCLLVSSALLTPVASSDGAYTGANSGTNLGTVQAQTSTGAYRIWRDKITLALKHEATADEVEQPAAIRSLIRLLRQTSSAPHLSDRQRSQLTNKLRRRIALRLRRMEGDLLAQVVDLPPPNAVAQLDAQPVNLDGVVQQIIEPQNWKVAGGAGQAVLFQQGPANIGGNAGQNGGEQLSELIQTVVAPESWEALGGPGVIAVFAQ